MIEIEGLTKVYTMGEEKVPALAGVSLGIARGEYVAVIGPSGSGKSTLMNILGGLDRPSDGAYRFEGEDVAHFSDDQLAEFRRRRIGFVFQSFQLLPRLTALQNVELPMIYAGLARRERRDLAAQLLERVGLGSRMTHRPTQLSGGQQQRVAIARALVLTPRILLLDEPLSNLDAKLRVQLREQLKELQHEVGVTTVYVTHDQEEALTLSDRIAVLDAGHLQQVGTPEEIYDRSGTPFVCRFIGENNRLTPAVLISLGSGSGDSALDATAESYIRPEKLHLAAPDAATDAAASLDGSVVGRTYHGSHSVYTVAVEDTTLRVSVPAGASAHQWDAGDAVRVDVDPRWILQYPAV